MKVNFNNLRRKAVIQLNAITEKLNSATEDGHISIDGEEIDDDMNHLISLVNSIAGVYKEGEEDFKDLTDELPEAVWFNGEEE